MKENKRFKVGDVVWITWGLSVNKLFETNYGIIIETMVSDNRITYRVAFPETGDCDFYVGRELKKMEET